MAAAGRGRPLAAMMGAGRANALQCAAGPAEGGRGKRRDARKAKVSGASGCFWFIPVPFQRNFGAIRCYFSDILVPFQCHFGAFWRNFGAILVPFWCNFSVFQCHFGAILVPFWCHFSAISMLFQCHFSAILVPFLVPFQCNFGLFQSHFSAFQCNFDATLVQFQCVISVLF